LQDAASQAVVDALPDLPPTARILDYCAGGGGKALAMAARHGSPVTAHDAFPRRMQDLPTRARRAGATVDLVTDGKALGTGGYDLVLCDVPCSGSGAWRRQPDSKWRLADADLKDLIKIQSTILAQASRLVAPGGVLAYATCSLIDAENTTAVETLVSANHGWALTAQKRWTPRDGADGFGLSILTRSRS
jgi:16S rRNA (cytosine967-C5)-methyltransferase